MTCEHGCGAVLVCDDCGNECTRGYMESLDGNPVLVLCYDCCVDAAWSE